MEVLGLALLWPAARPGRGGSLAGSAPAAGGSGPVEQRVRHKYLKREAGDKKEPFVVGVSGGRLP